MNKVQPNQAENARAALLVDTVRDARIAAEQGNWAKVNRLIATATEIAKDLPKADEILLTPPTV